MHKTLTYHRCFQVNYNGGGIYNSGILVLNNSTISSNSATSGGGIFNTGNVVLNNSTISSNSTPLGGGIFNIGNVEVNNSTISSNNSSRGASISNHTYTFINGVLVMGAGTLKVNNSTINGNTGKGIYNSRGTLDVNNSTINNNSNNDTSIFDTGIIQNSGGIVNVNNSTISDNFGNGILNSSLDVGIIKLSNSTISGNMSISDGGGISNGSRDTLEISNSTINGNKASRFGFTEVGGGISNYGTLVISDSTISNNSADRGGGVYNTGTLTSFPRSSAVLRNTIVAGNITSTKGADPDVLGVFTSNGYNLIGDGTGSTGFDATRDRAFVPVLYAGESDMIGVIIVCLCQYCAKPPSLPSTTS